MDPARALLLGCLLPKAEQFQQDALYWFMKSATGLMERGCRFQSDLSPAVENCFKAYQNVVHCVCKLEDSFHDAQKMDLLPLYFNSVQVLQNGRQGRLTAAHGPIVSICVQNRFYNLLKDFIHVTIVQVSPGLLATDYLTYFYYSGLAHIALKNHSKALDHLAMCQIVPGEACSMIQVDAQKKYILVSLIVHGQVVPLPDFVHPRLNKTHTKCCRAYMELEENFTQSAAALGTAVGRYYETFERDYNVGLVRQVMKAQEIARVRRLRNVYASCSIQVAAQQAAIEDPQRAKKILLYLIKTGELRATIDASDIVTFEKKQGASVNSRRYQEYAQALQEVMALTEVAEQTFYDVRTSATYVKNTTPNLLSDRKELANEMMLNV